MSLTTAPLGDVAPAVSVSLDKQPDDLVWQITLDHIEADSGRLLKKEMKPFAKAGTSTHAFDKRHVLYSKLRPYLNKVLLPDSEGIGTTELVPMLPDPERLDRRYLAHYLMTKHFVAWISEHSSGAKMPRATMADFWTHEIPLPSLPEQKRIAAILDKADAIRRKRQQAIDLADEFLRAVFLDMFGDPVTNTKGWEEIALIKLAKGGFQNGAYFPKEQYSDDGVEMVHMADAFYDTVKRGGLKRVNVSREDLKKYGLTTDDLLISRRSLNYEGAAKPSLVPESNEPLIFESSLIRLTPDRTKVDKLYLYNYLSNRIVKDHFIRKYVTGATIKGINQQNLEQVRVLLPPIELQKSFAMKVISLKKVGTKVRNQLTADIELFSSLSQKAFAGEL